MTALPHRRKNQMKAPLQDEEPPTSGEEHEMYAVTANTEEYRGETYRLERREIQTFRNARGYIVVWCWEVLTGPARGEFGGKCGTKPEARKWARHAIREIGPIRAAENAAAATV